MNKSINYIDGDIISLAKSGDYDVIIHGVNCMCTQKSGLAPQMVKAFGTNNFKLEHPKFKGDFRKLGNIDYETRYLKDDKWVANPDEGLLKLKVVNAYTQYNYGRNHSDGTKKPLNYNALNLCMSKVNHIFAGQKIILPRIGAGLAGGSWEKIEQIIQQSLVNCEVTIVNYKK